MSTLHFAPCNVAGNGSLAAITRRKYKDWNIVYIHHEAETYLDGPVRRSCGVGNQLQRLVEQKQELSVVASIS